MTNKIIDADALLEAIKNFYIPDTEYTVIRYVAFVVDKINELSTPVPAPQKQVIIDFYVAFKDTIEVELAKPLKDSLVGITADNAYIAGLQTSLRLADESAKYVIDRIAHKPQESVDADGWSGNFTHIRDLEDDNEQFLVKFDCYWSKRERIAIGCWHKYDDERRGIFEKVYDKSTLPKYIQIENYKAWRPLPKLPTGGNG
jgi:hypothetical protein